MSPRSPAEKAVRDIRRKTRKQYSAEEKIRIILDGLRGDESVAALCRREGIAESLYYSWSKEFLEADGLFSPKMVSVPVLRGDAVLAASWPDVRAHPWTSFATEPTLIEDPRVDEALRRLRKVVIAFRSHSRGRLARFKGKIEHARITKGTGQAVLETMLAEGVVSQEGSMYFLDPDRLMAQAGVNYADCMARRFGPEAIAFAMRALEAAD